MTYISLLLMLYLL